MNSSTNHILLVPSIYISYLIVEDKNSLIKIGNQERREIGNIRAFAFSIVRASNLDVLLKGSTNIGITYC